MVIRYIVIVFLLAYSNSHAGWDVYREVEKARSAAVRAEQAEALYNKARNTAFDLEHKLNREKSLNQSLEKKIEILEKTISELERAAEITNTSLIKCQDFKRNKKNVP